MTRKAGGEIRPKYDPVAVGGALFFEMMVGGGKPLKVKELIGKVVADQTDDREVAIATTALRELSEAALIVRRDDGRVEPTRAAFHADRLFGSA